MSVAEVVLIVLAVLFVLGLLSGGGRSGGYQSLTGNDLIPPGEPEDES